MQAYTGVVILKAVIEELSIASPSLAGNWLSHLNARRAFMGEKGEGGDLFRLLEVACNKLGQVIIHSFFKVTFFLSFR